VNVFTAELSQALLRMGLFIFIGWFLARQGLVVSAARPSIMRLVIGVFFPALIFSRVCNNPLLSSSSRAALYLGVGFAMVVVGILVSRLVAHLLGFKTGVTKRTFAYAAGINNFGYLGIPVTAALFNDHVMGVLLVHNVGVEAAVWTFGVAYLSGKKGWMFLKDLVQPMTVSLAIALVLNFLGWSNSAPVLFATQFTHVIGECAIPVGTILTGVYLFETIRGYRFFAEPRMTTGFILCRWLIIPMILLAAASFLIPDAELQKVMLVQAAMPAGIFSFLIVEMYKGDVAVALRCSVFTIAFCPLITPLWLYLGSRWLHLG